ncbi:unnamed protein product [Spirodela intermedia]|uniref:Uncharacterized protein n=1 Tax=Spirodela intermedia TaxID=51605 RepID=A0A7I8K736_SPIIN|nr:unnamed protein product [Spirodela intermedia]
MNSYFWWYRIDDDLCIEYIFWENESYAVDMASRLRNKYVPQ